MLPISCSRCCMLRYAAVCCCTGVEKVTLEDVEHALALLNEYFVTVRPRLDILAELNWQITSNVFCTAGIPVQLSLPE